MGTLTGRPQPEREHISIRTQSKEATGQRGVRKSSSVSVEAATPGDAKLALRIGREQALTEFTFDRADILPYLDAGVTTEAEVTFAPSTDVQRERWVGFRIPRAALPNLARFTTTLALDPVVANPGFQLVPIVVVHAENYFRDGSYVIGVSVVTAPEARAREA
jgi:hypothetical protein